MNANVPPLESGEWHQLNGFLDHLRRSVEAAALGLADDELARTVGRFSIGGILTHLAFMEDYWFGYVWTGRQPSEPWVSAPWDDDPSADWGMARGRGAPELLAIWRQAVELAQCEAVRSHLDDVSARDAGDGPVSKRWILLHMIEEYARHSGHADVLRELVAAGSPSRGGTVSA